MHPLISFTILQPVHYRYVNIEGNIGSGKTSLAKLKLFRRLAMIMQSSLLEPELLVNLHSPMKKLMKNISNLGRSYENDISADYLQRIQDSYFDFFKTQPQLRIVVIDVSNIDFVNQKKDFERIFEMINMPHAAGIKICTLWLSISLPVAEARHQSHTQFRLMHEQKQ